MHLAKFRPTRPAISVAAVVVAVGTYAVATGSASASIPAQIPAAQQTCAAGVPKLDYEYEDIYTGTSFWSNVCGFQVWPWNRSDYRLLAYRVATNPSDYRIWEHEDGLALCETSFGGDVYTWELGDGEQAAVDYWDNPNNLQLSSNQVWCLA